MDVRIFTEPQQGATHDDLARVARCAEDAEGRGTVRTPRLAARYAEEFNVAFTPERDVCAQFERVDAACAEIGRDPARVRRSVALTVALTVAVGRDAAEVAARAEEIGRTRQDQVEQFAAEVMPQLT